MNDIVAYGRIPPTDDELELALLGATDGLADDTDWLALYTDDKWSYR